MIGLRYLFNLKYKKYPYSPKPLPILVLKSRRHFYHHVALSYPKMFKAQHQNGTSHFQYENKNPKTIVKYSVSFNGRYCREGL